MKSRPKLMVQTFAAVNAHWWSFAAGGSEVVCISAGFPKTSVVPAGVVECPRVVGFASAVIS